MAYDRLTVINHETAHGLYAWACGLSVLTVTCEYEPGRWGHVIHRVLLHETRDLETVCRANAMTACAPEVLGFYGTPAELQMDRVNARAAAAAVAPESLDEWLDAVRADVRDYSHQPRVRESFNSLTLILHEQSTLPGADFEAWLDVYGPEKFAWVGDEVIALDA
jgi:hypothetical protein